jgi:hypothetical protein
MSTLVLGAVVPRDLQSPETADVERRLAVFCWRCKFCWEALQNDRHLTRMSALSMRVPSHSHVQSFFLSLKYRRSAFCKAHEISECQISLQVATKKIADVISWRIRAPISDCRTHIHAIVHVDAPFDGRLFSFTSFRISVDIIVCHQRLPYPRSGPQKGQNTKQIMTTQRARMHQTGQRTARF